MAQNRVRPSHLTIMKRPSVNLSTPKIILENASEVTERFYINDSSKPPESREMNKGQYFSIRATTGKQT